MFACLPICLLACLPAFLLCLLVHLPASRLPACLFACWRVCLRECFPACVRSCFLSVGMLVCLPVCLIRPMFFLYFFEEKVGHTLFLAAAFACVFTRPPVLFRHVLFLAGKNVSCGCRRVCFHLPYCLLFVFLVKWALAAAVVLVLTCFTVFPLISF